MKKIIALLLVLVMVLGLVACGSKEAPKTEEKKEETSAPATEEKPLTADEVNDIVEKAVQKAVAPILKARALPTAIGEGDADPVEKGEAHYLAGIL